MAFNETGRLLDYSPLQFGFMHLRKHKFKQSFQKTVNPLCCCRNGEI